MGSERHFAVGFGWRLLLLAGALALLAFALARPGLAAARLVAAAAVAGATWGLWRHVNRTNREVARFVEALRFGDFSQSFGRGGGGGFDELGRALDDAMLQLRAERAVAHEEMRIAAALADEAPSALLLIDDEGRVTLANKAARKTFSRLEGTRIADFAPYGAELVAALRGEGPLRKVLPLRIEGAVLRAVVSRASLERVGRPLGIVAVQPIQQELSAIELAAQADLVRVLTHEIMNSMTPVVSLAGSAAQMMAALDGDGDPVIADARLAIDTLARRASGIMHFVDAYRAFSRVPVVESRRFAALPWAQELERLTRATGPDGAMALDCVVVPPDMTIEADPDLLAQVVLNLLKNGAEAARGEGRMPELKLEVAPLPGGRTRIAVADNGPGIPVAQAQDIFLPFFTTKAGGTGVGLSLARRIVAAHGGTIALAPSDRGARFEIAL